MYFTQGYPLCSGALGALLTSVKLFFRGPIWAVAAVASAASTGIGLYQSIHGHKSIWLWLFLAALGVALASFISFHRNRVKYESSSEDVRAKIDALVRRGFATYKELNVGPIADETDEKGKGISFPIWPPESKWEPVYAFDHDARELLSEHNPGLLFAYADGVNAARRKRKRREMQRDKAMKNLSVSEQMRQTVERLHRRPAEELECYVNALVEVKKEI
jgi:hypothetical protein